MKKIFLTVIALTVIIQGALLADPFTQRQVSIETVAATKTNGQVKAGCRYVIFIFSGSFTGSIQGAAFTSSDSPLTIPAQSQDTLGDIYYTVTAGSVRIVQER